MKTIYYTASSLDGYIADKDNSLDWLFQFDEPQENYLKDFLSTIGAVVMGANTYKWMLDHQVHSNSEHSGAWPYSQPAWVFTSHELTGINGADIRFVSGDVLRVHKEITRVVRGKDIWVIGGGDVAGQFMDQGLLDEIKISIAPVTLGGGASVLPRMVTKPPLKLLSTKAYGATFVDLHYEVQR